MVLNLEDVFKKTFRSKENSLEVETENFGARFFFGIFEIFFRKSFKTDFGS
jgi:hypothetical protein